MITKSRILAIAALLLGCGTAFAQWQGSTTIQWFTGNVAIGTSSVGTPKLEVVNATGGYGNGTYMQVTGSTADNNNYPDIVLKGGNGAGYAMTYYPSVKLTNAGYALAMWGGSSSVLPNATVAVVDTASNSFSVSSGANTAMRSWGNGLVLGTSAAPMAALDIHMTPAVTGVARRSAVAFDPSASALGVGGGISFGGNYSAAGASTADFANIWGIKENGTDADNSGALLFATHTNGATPAERMRIASNGLVTIATSGSTGTKLQVNGDINVTGNINAKYQDVAEWVPANESIAAGTVVVLDPAVSNHVKPSHEAYSTSVAGVVSDRPGLILGEPSAGSVKIATTGRVLVHVDATKSPIRIGDLLVTSGEAGAAMRSEPVEIGGTKIHRPGTIIGKALQPLSEGRSDILVLLCLQ